MKMGSALMKQLEPKNSPEHKVSLESVVRSLYEVSSKTEFAAARNNAIAYSLWVKPSGGAYDY
jgi:hypothetical protein